VPPTKITDAVRIIGIDAIFAFRFRKSWLGRVAGLSLIPFSMPAVLYAG